MQPAMLLGNPTGFLGNTMTWKAQMDTMIKADAVLADKAYDRVRKSLREKGGAVVIL